MQPALRFIDGPGDARAKIETELVAFVAAQERASHPMTNRSTSADFVTAFATGWPEQQPDIMVLSLTTQKGVQDFALTRDQALLVAKTMKETAQRLAKPAGS